MSDSGRSIWDRFRRRSAAPGHGPSSVGRLLADLGLSGLAPAAGSWLDDPVVVISRRPCLDDDEALEPKWRASVRAVAAEEYVVHRGSGARVPSAGGRVGRSARWSGGHGTASEVSFHHTWPSTRTHARLVDDAVGTAWLRWRRRWPSTLHVTSERGTLAVARRGPSWSVWRAWPARSGVAATVHAADDGAEWGRIFSCPRGDVTAVVVERAGCPDRETRAVVLAVAFELDHRWWWTSNHFFGGG
jgi:hypothetical protein